MGASGGIGGTYGVMPELILKLESLVREDKMELARQVQYSVNQIIETLCSGHGNMYAVIKEVLRVNEKLDIGSVREPLTALTQEDLTIARRAASMIQEAIATYC